MLKKGKLIAVKLASIGKNTGLNEENISLQK